VSVQRVCDKCEKVIDESKPFWTVNVQKLQANADGGTTVVEALVAHDFHENHLPKDLEGGKPGKPEPGPDAPAPDHTLPGDLT
jgi:hypothetical protein